MEINELRDIYKDGIINGFEHQDDKYTLMNRLLTIGEMSVYDFMEFEEEIMNEQMPSSLRTHL